MPNIINRSNHPIHVKTIPIEIWTLKDEIDEQLKLKPDLKSDIERFYNRDYTVENLERHIPAKVSEGVVILSDINMTEILFFSNLKLTSGQLVSLRVISQAPFKITCRIVHCLDRTSRTKIIKATPLNFRISAALDFFDKEEEQSLREFLRAIEPVLPPSPTRIKESSKNDLDL